MQMRMEERGKAGLGWSKGWGKGSAGRRRRQPAVETNNKREKKKCVPTRQCNLHC